MYVVIILNKNMNWLSDIKIAHRGLHNISKGVPENTIAAFSKAIEQNIAIELDVHILKDNTIVVFHDDNLKRCCNVDKNIKELNISDIKKLRLFNTEHKIPTLVDVLDFIDSRVPVIIEIKSDVNAKKICPYLIEILKQYKGEFAIKSFDPKMCMWFKKHDPEVTRGLLITDFKNSKKCNILKKLFISSMVFLPIYNPDFLSISLSMLKDKKVKKYRQNGYLILGWTFKTKQDFIKYEHYCDSYIYEE